MNDEVTIGVATDCVGWHRQVMNAFERARAEGARVRAVLIDLHAHDWVARAQGYDALIWNPHFMGPVSASFFKEKLYFLEKFEGLRIMPNYASAWHFESKVAQSYLLEALDVPRPRTVVSFERDDAAAAARELGLPLVAKKSFGSSSENVRLIRTQQELDAYLEREFAQQHWNEAKADKGSALKAMASAPFSGWAREKVRRRVLDEERHGYVYFQEFIPGNDSDVRISVVGRRAAGCRRKNRPNDFRASGSNLIIRGFELPHDAIELCMKTTGLIGADCLVFDVLYRDGSPLIVEMSYMEEESENPAHWVKEPDGSLTRHAGDIWDQELWVKHILDEFGL